MSLEHNEPKKPGISLIEKDTGTKPGRFPGHQEKIIKFDTPRDPDMMTPGEYDDELKETRENVLENEILLKRITSAIIAKASTGEVRGLAEIENRLVKECINLRDADIDSLISKLTIKIQDYLLSVIDTVDVRNGQALEDLKTGRWRSTQQHQTGWGSSGIKSVVQCVQARTKLLCAAPAQEFELGFNNKLDAKYKIDLIETIYTPNKEIYQLNLIQVKSTPPSAEEIKSIRKNHKEWVDKKMMPTQDIEDLSIPKDTERVLFEETLDNQTKMFEQIFEICVDYKSSGVNELMRTLGLDVLDNLQRAWVLDIYFDKIKERIEAAHADGYVKDKSKDDLIRDLSSLRQSLLSKSGIPMNVVKIHSVNSIINVGAKTIDQVEIYNEQNKPLAATYGL